MASVGFLAAMYRAFRRDIQNAQARVSTGSSMVNTERGLIEYASVGEGAPVLVVHGIGGGFDQALPGLLPNHASCQRGVGRL